MRQSTVRHSAIQLPGGEAFQADAAQIAVLLAQAAGARDCYLALIGNAGQRPRLIASSADASRPRSSAVANALKRICREVTPMSIDGAPALLLPVQVADEAAGSALLVYEAADLIDTARASAAAALAASTLDSMRQVAVLHVQAEELEARSRMREIQVSRNLLRGVIDGIPLGLALLDDKGLFLAVNRALSERFGLDPAELVGMPYSSVIGPWEEAPAAQTFATGNAQRIRRQISRAGEVTAFIDLASFPLVDADGQPLQVVEVWEDVTERVALQTQLVRAERLAAIGQLAASIAHEVGNPLQAIQGFLSLFLEQSLPETPNRTFLELAEEEIERIVQVISRLRDLYRPRVDVMRHASVNEVLETVLLLTSKQLERARVAVSTDLTPYLPPVVMVADQMKQVFLNLILNAIDAMRDGGTLTVRTDPVVWNGGEAVLISVADTGMGIEPAQVPLLFDGLHTTKERGMGLGLYTSKAIIERHMGRVQVQSEIGQGTTFLITLPIGEEEQNQ